MSVTSLGAQKYDLQDGVLTASSRACGAAERVTQQEKIMEQIFAYHREEDSPSRGEWRTPRPTWC